MRTTIPLVRIKQYQSMYSTGSLSLCRSVIPKLLLWFLPIRSSYQGQVRFSKIALRTTFLNFPYQSVLSYFLTFLKTIIFLKEYLRLFFALYSYFHEKEVFYGNCFLPANFPYRGHDQNKQAQVLVIFSLNCPYRQKPQYFKISIFK